VTNRWSTSSIALRSLVLLALVDFLYVATVRPDWQTLTDLTPPKSVPIHNYEEKLQANSKLAPLRWSPISAPEMPDSLKRIVVANLAPQFFNEGGINTITEKVAEHMILGHSQTPVGKWHSMVFAVWMERQLTKNQILNLYLNVTEAGPGIFGIGAAAQAYWKKRPKNLSPDESIELAATLANPTAGNPANRTSAFLRDVDNLRRVVKGGRPTP